MKKLLYTTCPECRSDAIHFIPPGFVAYHTDNRDTGNKGCKCTGTGAAVEGPGKTWAQVKANRASDLAHLFGTDKVYPCKCVVWAYPTSTSAERYHMARVGCWVVNITSMKDGKARTRAVLGGWRVDQEAEAIQAARERPEVWASWSKTQQ